MQKMAIHSLSMPSDPKSMKGHSAGVGGRVSSLPSLVILLLAIAPDPFFFTGPNY